MRTAPLSIILLLSVLTLFNSCNKEKSTNDFDDEQVAKEVRQMLDDYFAAIRESGLRAEFEYLDQSSDFFWVPPGFNSAISYDSVKIILESNADSFKEVEFYWDTLLIIPISINIANYTGIVKGSITDSQDSINPVSMIETGTVIRRVNGWKILSGQSRNLDL